MQEEVTEITVVLSVRTAKMTARVLQSVLRKLLASMKKVHARLSPSRFSGQAKAVKIRGNCKISRIW